MTNQEVIYQKVKCLKEAVLVGLELEGWGQCFYWTICGFIVLRQNGYDPTIQAGNASWPMINMKDDDGKMDTHWSYIWSPQTPQSQYAMATGGIPEMHSWLGIVKTQELIDFSTGGVKEQAIKHELKWTGPAMPTFIWQKANTLQGQNIVYVPVAAAVRYYLHILQHPNCDGMVRALRYGIDHGVIDAVAGYNRVGSKWTHW